MLVYCHEVLSLYAWYEDDKVGDQEPHIIISRKRERERSINHSCSWDVVLADKPKKR